MKKKRIDPFQLMQDLALEAKRIANQRGIPQPDLEGWSACLDEAWGRLGRQPFKSRQELAEWCNNRIHNRSNRHAAEHHGNGRSDREE